MLKAFHRFEVLGASSLLEKWLSHQRIEISLQTVTVTPDLQEPLPHFFGLRAFHLHLSVLLLKLRLFILGVRQHRHQLLLVAFVVFVDVLFYSVLSPDVFQLRPSVHKPHFGLPLFGL
jgi:hypothetical protein